LPYPTLANEILDAKTATEAQAPPPLKIAIDTIRFDDDSELPSAMQGLLKDARSGIVDLQFDFRTCPTGSE